MPAVFESFRCTAGVMWFLQASLEEEEPHMEDGQQPRQRSHAVASARPSRSHRTVPSTHEKQEEVAPPNGNVLIDARYNLLLGIMRLSKAEPIADDELLPVTAGSSETELYGNRTMSSTNGADPLSLRRKRGGRQHRPAMRHGIATERLPDSPLPQGARRVPNGLSPRSPRTPRSARAPPVACCAKAAQRPASARAISTLVPEWSSQPLPGRPALHWRMAPSLASPRSHSWFCSAPGMVRTAQQLPRSRHGQQDDHRSASVVIAPKGTNNVALSRKALLERRAHAAAGQPVASAICHGHGQNISMLEGGRQPAAAACVTQQQEQERWRGGCAGSSSLHVPISFPTATPLRNRGHGQLENPRKMARSARKIQAHARGSAVRRTLAFLHATCTIIQAAFRSRQPRPRSRYGAMATRCQRPQVEHLVRGPKRRQGRPRTAPLSKTMIATQEARKARSVTSTSHLK